MPFSRGFVACILSGRINATHPLFSIAFLHMMFSVRERFCRCYAYHCWLSSSPRRDMHEHERAASATCIAKQDDQNKALMLLLSNDKLWTAMMPTMPN